MERHFATIWESIADTAPDAPALAQGPVRRTWREFDDRAGRVAGALLDAGLGPGSRVALYLYNCPEYLEAFFAALKIRAVPCNINYRYLDRELLYLLSDSEAEAIVFHSSLGARVERVLPEVGRVKLAVEVADDRAHVAEARPYEDLVAQQDAAPRTSRHADDPYFVYTGGTTGMPKGVVRPIGPAVDRIVATLPPRLGYGEHSEPESLIERAKAEAGAGRSLVSLPAAPLMHHTGLGLGATPALTAGGRVVLLSGRRFDPGELWDMVARERVVVFAIVGDPFARPLLSELTGAGDRTGSAAAAAHGDKNSEKDRDLGSLRLVFSAGAMFSAEVKAGLLEHLPGTKIVDFIASTETAAGTSVATMSAVPPTGQFTPFPGVLVVRDDGVPLKPGSEEAGILAVPGAFGGYHNDESKTAETVREIDGVTYTLSGDFATWEADGTIVLLGRGSGCINTGGEKVFAEEVEEAAKRLTEVDDCLVFGVPDERFGQKVVGVVSFRPGMAAPVDDLLTRLRTELAAYKVPRDLVVVGEIPRAPSGKADYPAARAVFD